MNDFDFDPIDNRNGKIARLPRSLRERINRALYDRFPAVKLCRELNQMPQVKAVLAQHFDNRPILPQNISEWKQGGYRDWLRRQQVLEQKRELAADAKDLADTANGMADSLFGMVTLDYAHLLMNRDKEDPEQFEKKRKALSVLSQDIVRLRRSHLTARRVQVQETKLENEKEKTEEQLHFKFKEWAENPDVRKALVLAPLESDRQMRILWDLPPAPEDPLVEKETKDDPYFQTFRRTKTNIKPNPTGNSNSSSNPPPSPAPEKTPESNDHVNRSTATPSPSGRGRGEGELNTSTLPPNSYVGRNTRELIEECEEKYAQEQAARLNSQTSERTSILDNNVDHSTAVPSPLPSDGRGEGQGEVRVREKTNSNVNPQNSSFQKPNPFDSVSEPVHYAPQPGPTPPLYGPCEPPLTRSSAYNFRPPPGFNSLG